MSRYMGQPVAEKLGELVGLSLEDREVVAYGLEYFLTGLIGVVLTLLAGLVMGLFWETLAVLSCWGMLRLFAGGAHCTALWRCTVASIAGMLTAVLAAKVASILVPPAAWIAVCTTWALLAVWLWAPNNSERPVHDSRRRRRLRKRALSLVIFLGVAFFYPFHSGIEQLQILAVAGATGLVAGALLISPPGFQLINWCDQKMQHLYYTFSSSGKGGETDEKNIN